MSVSLCLFFAFFVAMIVWIIRCKNKTIGQHNYMAYMALITLLNIVFLILFSSHIYVVFFFFTILRVDFLLPQLIGLYITMYWKKSSWLTQCLINHENKYRT